MLLSKAAKQYNAELRKITATLDNILNNNKEEALSQTQQIANYYDWVRTEYNLQFEDMIEHMKNALRKIAITIWSAEAWASQQILPDAERLYSTIQPMHVDADNLHFYGDVVFVLPEVGNRPQPYNINCGAIVEINLRKPTPDIGKNEYPQVRLAVWCNTVATQPQSSIVVLSAGSEIFNQHWKGIAEYSNFARGAIDVERIKHACNYAARLFPLLMNTQCEITLHNIPTDSILCQTIINKLKDALSSKKIGQHIWAQQADVIPERSAYWGYIAADAPVPAGLPERADEITRSSLVIPFYIGRTLANKHPNRQPDALCVLVEIPLLWRADADERAYARVRITAMPVGALASYLPAIADIKHWSVITTASLVEPQSVFVDIPPDASPDKLAESVANAAADLFANYANTFVQRIPAILPAIHYLLDGLEAAVDARATQPTVPALQKLLQASENNLLTYNDWLFPAEAFANMVENIAQSLNVQLDESEINALRNNGIIFAVQGSKLSANIRAQTPQSAEATGAQQQPLITQDKGELKVHYELQLEVDVVFARSAQFNETSLFKECFQNIPIWRTHLMLKGTTEAWVERIQWARQPNSNIYQLFATIMQRAQLTPQTQQQTQIRLNLPSGSTQIAQPFTLDAQIDLDKPEEAQRLLHNYIHQYITVMLQCCVFGEFINYMLPNMLREWFNAFINTNKDRFERVIKEYLSAKSRGMKR